MQEGHSYYTAYNKYTHIFDLVEIFEDGCDPRNLDDLRAYIGDMPLGEQDRYLNLVFQPLEVPVYKVKSSEEGKGTPCRECKFSKGDSHVDMGFCCRRSEFEQLICEIPGVDKNVGCKWFTLQKKPTLYDQFYNGKYHSSVYQDSVLSCINGNGWEYQEADRVPEYKIPDGWYLVGHNHLQDTTARMKKGEFAYSGEKGAYRQLPWSEYEVLGKIPHIEWMNDEDSDE